ncbi:YHS domain-containing (seleno)protein [Sphingomonas sp. PAMC 26605]|uniref:YHS domain-containing (seleno)protein n=1 Tax=Sphingomonas sp. PAMC 26605 TaxID=1112214 RepID=UPI00026CCAE7|nr:YHS domain-containing (seleno)protein [Sphingomonas sp. PAMC 26605]
MLCFDHRRLAAALLILSAPASGLIPTMAQAAVPGSTASVNVDQAGVALRGFDPVAYFETGKPTKGVDAIATTFDGVRYLFATEAHRRTFLAAPAKYVPQFGGFCAVGTSFGEKVDADPQTGRVVDGKLYVNYSAKTQMIFDKDVPGTIARAEQNWPKVKDKPQ